MKVYFKRSGGSWAVILAVMLAPLAAVEGVRADAGAQPRLAYELKSGSAALELSAVLDGVYAADGAPTVEIAAAGTRAVRKRAGVEQGADGRTRLVASFPWSELGGRTEAVRLALIATWPSAGLPLPVRRERYLVRDGAAPHADIPSDPGEWTEIDLAEHRQIMADREAEIAIELTQPMDGKVTMVVEDAAGRRIRNLVAGIAAAEGDLRLVWDGRDEDGNFVTPGDYRWRSAHHPGIAATYLSSFANGEYGKLKPFGTNHGQFIDACADGDRVILAGALAEGGYAMISYDREGVWQRGYNFKHGTPHKSVAVAAAGGVLYCVNEGKDQAKDDGSRHNPDWVGPHHITLSRFEIESGKPMPIAKQEFLPLFHYEAPVRGPTAIKGVTHLDGKLYIAATVADGVLVVDADTGEQVAVHPVADIRGITRAGDGLLVVSGKRVLRFGADGAQGEVVADLGEVEIRGVAVDEAGGIYISDSISHQVIALGADGRERRRYGVPGGPYRGEWVRDRLVNPRGIAVFDGRLYVTESRRNPKRVCAFDLATGEVVEQRFGNPPYGGSGAGVDGRDHTRWIGMGCQWSFDPAAGEHTAEPVSIFAEDQGHFGGSYNWAYRYRYEHLEGRTFVVGSGFIQTISELRDDGSLRDLAAFSTVHSWDYGCGWKPDQGFLDAMAANGIPADKLRAGENKQKGVLWVDADGDGLCDADEFEVLGDGTQCTGTRWGTLALGLGFAFGADIPDKGPAIIRIEPDGWLPQGAPKYPTLAAAAAAATVIPVEQRVREVRHYRAESVVDRFGTFIANTDPHMVGYTPAGELAWRYPNQWVGVHGSHKAPLPETGVMQGNLFFLGRAELDERSDVVVLNGNHGRYSFLSSDGLYLDECFRDVRMGGSRDDQWVGGEPFGGTFAKCEDGRYYLQTGGDGFRVYRVDGLDRLVRAEGALTVSSDQILAAQRRAERATAAESGGRVVIQRVDDAPKIDGRVKEWDKIPAASWSKGSGFSTEAWIAVDEQRLYLAFKVRDSSAWRNTGNDWQTLFKTGDSVDLQLGVDPEADPERKGPVPGDLRLLAAPYEDGTAVVRYRHRLPKGEQGAAVTFTSPWRSEVVADVVRIDGQEGVEVAVGRGGNGYELELAVPLALLGFEPAEDATYRIDLGTIYGDDAGTINLLRSYWSNQATGLVNDVPGEIMLAPRAWGDAVLAEGE